MATEITAEKIDCVEALASLSMVQHRLDIYLSAIAQRADSEGSTFYQRIVADCKADIAAVEKQIKAAI